MFSCRKIAIFKDWSFEKSVNNPIEIDAKFAPEKKGSTRFKKRGLGRSWAPFGRGLGRSGGSFAHSWALLGRFGGVRDRAFIEHWSKIGSKRPSGSILGGSWRGLGGFWGGFGRFVGGF